MCFVPGYRAQTPFSYLGFTAYQSLIERTGRGDGCVLLYIPDRYPVRQPARPPRKAADTKTGMTG